MKYTAGEAGKAAGVSTATITRAIKGGRISAQKDDSGAWRIDPVELHRVYPPVAAKDDASPSMQGDVTHMKDGALQAELDVMREKLRAAEALQDAAETDRDAWRAQAERLAKALPAPKTERPSSRWRWPWR